jgi:formate-dependent nitrite reductase membrane component NrfD
MALSDPLSHRLADLTVAYRPQRQWIDGRGILIVVAHFFTGIGAGAWLFSAIVGYDTGLVAGLVLVAVLGGGAHLLFLGQWARVWRMVSRPHQSWISRGLLGIALFVPTAAAYVTAGAPEGWAGAALLTLSLAGVAVILTYQGFVLAVSRAIPFWRSPLLPPLYAAYALRGGAAVLLLATALTGDHLDEVDDVELVKLWVVASSAVLVLVYLVLANRGPDAARQSVHQLVTGRISPVFYGGVVIAGLALPLVAGAIGYATDASRVLIGIVAASSLVGDFYVKYCVARAGIYRPVTAGLPAWAAHPSPATGRPAG